MRTVFAVGAVLLAIAACTFFILFTLPFARVTVQVSDEEGKPVPNAAVNFGFLEARPKWGEAIGVPVKTTTDSAGIASGWGHSDGKVGCSVTKEGYYEGGPYIAPSNDIFLLHFWLPWNPTCKVVLKKIINPIPVYAKPVRLPMPALNRPIGFDLVAGDWVRPFGKGIYSDFVFTMSHSLKDPRDFYCAVDLNFTHQGDGLQVAPQINVSDQGGSRLNFPRNAPQDGYKEHWTTIVSRGSTGNKDCDLYVLGYLFRVRTIRTAQGGIQSADYGKIKGDISIVGAATDHPGIAFIYYFNPTGTTNLEFDPSKNLFTNLDEFQCVLVQYP